MAERPADRIRKLVAFASADDGPEAPIAQAKARDALAALDTELLDTLAGQRKRLLEEMHEECRRLWQPGERATKADTGELVSSAMTLFRHYERVDALIPAVLLARIEAGHRLTNDERQQLDGPVEDMLERWSRDIRARRKAQREQRKAERRSNA